MIALVGERGREVREFIERDLGDALERSVVVVATSDQPALVRIKAAFTATTIAEYFRDQGHDVMLMMDSVTRFAMAQREVGPRDRRAAGHARLHAERVRAAAAPARARRHERRAARSPALYTVLVDGDDMNEPIADAVRSILDGHVVLTRSLAHAGHYPAIDVLQSVSRLVGEIVTPEVRRGRPAAARRARGAAREGGPGRDRRLPARAATRRSTPRSRTARGSSASCASPSTSAATRRRPTRACSSSRARSAATLERRAARSRMPRRCPRPVAARRRRAPARRRRGARDSRARAEHLSVRGRVRAPPGDRTPDRRAKERARAADNQAVTGPSFRFRLERVRAVRERKEKLAQQELARRSSRAQRHEASCAAPRPSSSTPAPNSERRARARTIERRRAAGPPGLPRARRGAAQLQRARARARARPRSPTAAPELATAAGEHEMLKRLRERQRGEHDRESARRERNALDEIAAARFGRGTA